jgi:hypothetical protein
MSSADDLLKLGLEYAGFDEKSQERSNLTMETKIRRFRAHYGVDPAAIEALITDLEQQGPVTPKKLFMAICWLKLYEIEEAMAGRWGRNEKYCRETVREYLERIQALKEQKISFLDLPPGCKFLGVDTVHVPFEEFTCDPSSKWWSHKFNGPGVSFEVVTDPVEGKIR